MCPSIFFLRTIGFNQVSDHPLFENHRVRPSNGPFLTRRPTWQTTIAPTILPTILRTTFLTILPTILPTIFEATTPTIPTTIFRAYYCGVAFTRDGLLNANADSL